MVIDVFTVVQCVCAALYVLNHSSIPSIHLLSSSELIFLISINLPNKRGQIKHTGPVLHLKIVIYSESFFFLPFLPFHCLTMADGYFVVLFLWSKQM